MQMLQCCTGALGAGYRLVQPKLFQKCYVFIAGFKIHGCTSWLVGPAAVVVIDHEPGLAAVNADIFAGDESSLIRTQE